MLCASVECIQLEANKCEDRKERKWNLSLLKNEKKNSGCFKRNVLKNNSNNSSDSNMSNNNNNNNNNKGKVVPVLN
jgi:hypothetical protein